MSIKLLSFLGTGEYSGVIYSYKKDDFEYIDQQRQNFVQVSTYSMVKSLLLAKGIEEDIETIIYMTDMAKKKNYEGTYEFYDNKKIKRTINYEPLCNYKKQLNIKAIDILDGKSEEEIWSNFSIILDSIDMNDRIFVDVTHSFRSIPIMFMALLNYAKVSKHITVEGIYYGAFESKNADTGIVPIFDLTSFIDMLDWTQNANILLTKGGCKQLIDKCNNILKSLYRKAGCPNELEILMIKTLKKINLFFDALNYSDVRNVCYSVTFLKDYLKEVRDLLDSGSSTYSNQIKPFIELLTEITQITDRFLALSDDETIVMEYESNRQKLINNPITINKNEYHYKIIENTNAMIEVCIIFELYQQAITLIQENIISIITNEMNLDIFDEGDRNTARTYLELVGRKSSETDTRGIKLGLRDGDKIRKFYDDNYNEAHLQLARCKDNTTNLRNRVNHASMNRNNSANIYKGIDTIKDSYETIKTYIIEP